MAHVLGMLPGDVQVGSIPSKPTYLVDWSVDDDSNFLTNEASGYSKAGYSSTCNYTTTRGQSTPSDNVSANFSNK